MLSPNAQRKIALRIWSQAIALLAFWLAAFPLLGAWLEWVESGIFEVTPVMARCLVSSFPVAVIDVVFWCFWWKAPSE